jgi:DNA polymerase-1
LTRIVIDIEADNLLKEVTKVHCIGTKDTFTGETKAYHGSLDECLEQLYQANELIGHNISAYDLPVLKKLYNWDPNPTCKITDTLPVARVIHPNIRDKDQAKPGFEKALVGKHSLKAWGYRLGVIKGDYGLDDATAWEQWSQEMQDYMMQDVEVTYALWKYLKPDEYSQQCLELEQKVYLVCERITEAGWKFDVEKAKVLAVDLSSRRDELERKLIAKFGTWQEVDKVLIPKRDDKKRGYVKGVPVTKYKTVVFNPGSRVHIEKKLRELGWKPEVFTESGRAKLDEPEFLKINLPEAKDIVEYLLVQKRISQLSCGDAAWLRLVDAQGFLHGSYLSNGCVTGRASHFNPNKTQVPSVDSPYGDRCRELFTVPPSWTLVGADMQGLELRCLAHYLSTWDGGEYTKVVTEGDPHEYNRQAAGLPTRANAKTFIYGWIYGAGDEKVGKIVGGTKAHGKKLKETFLKAVPAISKLRDAVKAACGKGYIKGLDGRHVPIKSDHSALNYLLQGAGAVLCKQWLSDFYTQACLRWNWGYDGDFVIVGWIHDELQVACRAEIAQEIGELLVSTAREAGKPYNFKTPLDSKYAIGNNWKDTH